MSYKKGRNFEYAVKSFIEEMGYIVFRSAGSHGLWDLIAVRGEEVLLVQCKLQQLFVEDVLKRLVVARIQDYLEDRALYSGKFVKIIDIDFPQYIACYTKNYYIGDTRMITLIRI